MWIMGKKQARRPSVEQGSGAAGVVSPPAQSAAIRNPVVAAMVWLATHLVQGYAAYGHAMYPVFAVSGELLGQTGKARGALLWEEERQMTEVLWVHAANPWAQEYLLRSATPRTGPFGAGVSSWERCEPAERELSPS
jgi:hypothetical protein